MLRDNSDNTFPSPDKTIKTVKIIEKHFDPITRIIGSLGIYTKIDFANREVVECHSTSSIFRGYSVFLRDKDPRDAHLMTSRICGICGDNHATCAVYAQNMAMAEWIINLGEAAEFMFDHNLYQDNLVGVDYCEKMVKETNPGCWEKAQRAEATGSKIHGFKTIAGIMTALNPFEGEIYKEALQMSRLTREMFCLMEGRLFLKGTPIFEENDEANFKGIDIMRVIRSFDPCMPCGVHFYTGKGKILETHHSSIFGYEK